MSVGTTITGKVIGLAGAALGLFLLNDQRKFTAEQAQLADHDMVDENYLDHLVHSAGDASPNGTLNHWKHKLLNPANWHFITRPMIHLRHYRDMLLDNIVPIGLIGASVCFGFGLNPGKLLVGAAQYGGSALKLMGQGIGQVGKAFGSFLGPVLSEIKKVVCTAPSAPTALALTALAGMGLYVAHLFKREITDESRESAFNFMQPPHGH